MTENILLKKIRSEFENDISHWNRDRLEQAYDILRQKFREYDVIQSITKMKIELIEREMKRRDGESE